MSKSEDLVIVCSAPTWERFCWCCDALSTKVLRVARGSYGQSIAFCNECAEKVREVLK